MGANDRGWTRFSAHWEELAPDRYAAALGTRRLRRYGKFTYTPADGAAKRMSHESFMQPEDSNPLYIGESREFEPLTDQFAQDPLLHAVLRRLGRVATVLDTVREWTAKVHPFRVVAAGDAKGQPTPEGLHRDGVTLVSSLLVGRRNAVGGVSSVVTMDGRRIVLATLSEPGDLLVADDRRTLHGVSPIRRIDRAQCAQRDVLVITFAPSSSQDRPRSQ